MTRAPLLTRPFALLVAGHFLQALGYSSMLLLPLYLDHLGASNAQIGAIMAAGAVGGLLSRPAVGWALDAVGRRPTLIVGTLVLSAGMGLVATVTDTGPLVYLERIVFGAGQGALFTAYFTFAADLVPPSRRTEGIALFGVSGLLPLLVNPLTDRLGVDPGALRWFLPAIGGLILVSLLFVRALPEPRSTADAAPLRLVEVLRSLRAKPLAPVWLMTVVFSGAVATFMSFATVAAERRGIPSATMLWLGYPLAAASVRVFGARLPDRVGPSNVVAPALLSYGLALVVVAGATSLTDLIVAGVLAGLAHGYCFPVLVAQVVDRVPPSHRGSGLAMFTALWGVSEVAVSPALGAFADAHGDAPMFALAASLCAVALGVWAALEHRLAPSLPSTL